MNERKEERMQEKQQKKQNVNNSTSENFMKKIWILLQWLNIYNWARNCRRERRWMRSMTSLLPIPHTLSS